MKTYTLNFLESSKVEQRTFKESEGWQFTYDAFGLWLEKERERWFYPFSGPLVSVKIAS